MRKATALVPFFKRISVYLFVVLSAVLLTYWLWSPGEVVNDGRHDLGQNGIWLQHGWLGDDSWFNKYKRDVTRFRSVEKIRNLRDKLIDHNIVYVYPHLCPCSPSGSIAQVDKKQTELFLNEFSDFKILPWVGGVFSQQCWPSKEKWRNSFCESVAKLLKEHPRLSGVHINIEPLPNGHTGFLLLLKELKNVLGPNKILSLAAYPPPTRWHPFTDLHWDKEYYQEISAIVDQMVPMLYDTSINNSKLYRSLVSDWTEEVLRWSVGSEVLLGIPAYSDHGVGYHNPNIENLENGLMGIHEGLLSFKSMPRNYRGICIYSEWEMDPSEWSSVKTGFLDTNK